VKVADRLFLKHGFDAVTIDQIAAECGISARTIPRYFPTKEDIALAPHRDTLERFKGDLEHREGDVISCWRRYVEQGTSDMIAAERRLRRYWAMVAAAPSLDAGRLAIFQEYEDVMADAIAEETGDREGMASRLRAALLIAGYAGLARHVLSSPDHHVDSAVFLNAVDHVADCFRDYTPARNTRRAAAPKRKS
jgi:AcrR family transcriptional regulator